MTRGTAATDADGRVTDLGPDRLEPGDYRVTFGTGDYFAGRGSGHASTPASSCGSPSPRGRAHYHVPLLLSPYSYTTYRGS